ncbi:aminotransferase [Sphingomonas sp. NSE70-1]|uniref:Aminotransferase n=1 Tax=Sphingomonas caseinilyticus TaxID=2908205 RepID=A0ABT0RQM8_9SPHN|nr:aminotransferase [Sphingomonas caseinilyticus]MCL6697323.1 aminotransferase [Sphingomonas caseinilyticus]
MNPLYQQMETSVFERMSLAAAKHGAVNLGQGFPDFGWSPEILEAAAKAVVEGSNQYAPSRGLPALREAVAAHYGRHQGLDLSAENICVTSGATEALAAAILATVEPGDEVIIFTPAYDAYAPLIRRAGGLPVEVALQPPGWRIERSALEAAISPSTKAIVFNNPHNPTGRLFDRDELGVIAEFAVINELVVISDEVWEHILLDGQAFTPIAALPGMASRTLKCGSAGKIFSLTGWKIGWLAASTELATLAARAHQFLTFASAPNLQAAVAYGLNEGDGWLQPMRDHFARARDRMTAGLEAAGFAVLPSASTYFMCVDLAASGISLDDEAFATQAVAKAGVAVVPLSPFAEQEAPRHLIRLCFAKRDETIDAGVEAMARARNLIR